MPKLIFDIIFFIKHLGCRSINILYQMILVSAEYRFINICDAGFDYGCENILNENSKYKVMMIDSNNESLVEYQIFDSIF